MGSAMIVAALALGLAPGSGGLAATVYDNTAAYTGVEHELLSSGQTHSEEHGNQITLDGAERVANELRFVLRIHGAGVAAFDYRMRFYENDGPGGVPGTLLFESPLTHRVIDSGAPLTYAQALPDITVPDSFTWTVQVSNRTGNMARFGPSEYNPPAIGSAPFGYWRRVEGTGDWEFTGLAEAPFGARLTAEMAPAGVEGAPRRQLSLRVWPNPSRGSVVFELNGSRAEDLASGRLLILDVTGRTVDQRIDVRLPVRWSPETPAVAGTYFAVFSGADETMAVPFVVVR